MCEEGIREDEMYAANLLLVSFLVSASLCFFLLSLAT